eukprot:1143089-Pelagomonas_calceolata.AAC.10
MHNDQRARVNACSALSLSTGRSGRASACRSAHSNRSAWVNACPASTLTNWLPGYASACGGAHAQ